MDVICDELVTTLSTNITITKDAVIPSLAIGLAIYNSPSGAFTLTISDASGDLKSEDFTVSELKTALSTANDYFHMVHPFEFSTPLIVSKDQVLTFALSSNGYTFSDSSFIGWVQPHENIFINRTNSFQDPLTNPYEVLIYKYGVA